MAITTKWNDKNKSLIISSFSDPYTLQDLLEARKRWHRMIKGVEYCVPIVLEMHDTFEPPKGFMRDFIAIHRTPHPRQGHIYIIGLNPLYERLSQHLFDGVVDPTKSVLLIDTIDEIVVR